MAGPGVGDQAGRDKWKEMEENFFFSRDSDAPFGPKVRGFEARLGPELDGKKLWRDQVLGTRLGETSGRKWKKTSFFSRDSDAPFGPKVRGFEARLGPELDGEKLWRDQVLGTTGCL